MSNYADPLARENPYVAQTRLNNLDARLQRARAASVNQTAAQKMRADAIKAGAIPSAIPAIPSTGSDFAAFDKRMSGLPGYAKGPNTIQNTQLNGTNASTPGANSRIPAAPLSVTGRADPWTPNAQGRMVPPTGRLAPPPPPLDITPPASTAANGVRTVQIDPKYQTPGAPTVGVAVDPWRIALQKAHPDIFQAGTAANRDFVDAHKNSDGTVKPIDPTQAMTIANNLQAQRAGDKQDNTEFDSKIQSDRVQRAGDKAANADFDANVKAQRASTDSAVALAGGVPQLAGVVGAPLPGGSQTSATPLPPAATSPVNPNLNATGNVISGGLDTLGNLFANGVRSKVNYIKQIGSNVLGLIKNPVGTITNGIANGLSAVGSAVGPAVLSPQGMQSATDAANGARAGAQTAANAVDSFNNMMTPSPAPAIASAVQSGTDLPGPTVPSPSPPMPVESDEDKKARLAMIGLPGY